MIRSRSQALALLALACAVLVPFPAGAQAPPPAQTIVIRMLDARSGRQLTPDNFLIRFDHQSDLHNETLKIADDGSGRIAVPTGASFLSVQGTFDHSMSIFVNCDSGKEKDQTTLHWYTIADILSSGVIAPNECFNGKYERPRIAAKPGEFDFYVRAHNWRDPGAY